MTKKLVHWLWLSLPSASFAPLRNLGRRGLQRTGDCPEGDECLPHVKWANDLWRRAVHLAGILVLGSTGRVALNFNFFTASFNAAGPAEPRSKIQESRASWFLVLGSTGRVALNFNF